LHEFVRIDSPRRSEAVSDRHRLLRSETMYLDPPQAVVEGIARKAPQATPPISRLMPEQAEVESRGDAALPL
jgi:hypothetical protein